MSDSRRGAAAAVGDLGRGCAASDWKLFCHAAQCSRSTICRRRSPIRAAKRPQAPCEIASSHDSTWCSPIGSRKGSEVAIEQVPEAALQLLVQPLPLGGIDERAGGGREITRRPGVDDDQADVAEVAAVAEAVGARLPVDPVGEGVQRVAHVRLVGTGVRDDPLPDLVLRTLGGREVAEVLVHPVRRQPGDDAAVPPRRGLHLLLPVQRGVPVVAHVVVVEDHGARHGRQQPPVGVVRPCEPVQVRVLLVVLQLLARRLADVAPIADELLHAPRSSCRRRPGRPAAG